MAETRSALARSCDRIAWTIEHVLAVGLIVAILFNFFNVVGRYITGFTLTGLDEIEVYLLIWIAFLNAAVVSWRREHLRMDLLVTALPGPMQRAVHAFETIVTLMVTTLRGLLLFPVRAAHLPSRCRQRHGTAADLDPAQRRVRWLWPDGIDRALLRHRALAAAAADPVLNGRPI